MKTRTASLVLLALAIPLLLDSPGFATDRFYRDQSVVSLNGRYQLDAKSPDNAGERPKPFARNFTYTLRDTKTDEIVWTRAQREGSPVELFLHDDLWVIIRTSGDDLVVLEPVTGRATLSYDILNLIPDSERNEFVAWTTAGNMWSGRSRWSFLEHDGSMHFVVRAWWDRRFIANLSEARVVTVPDDELLAACRADDRAFVLKSLEGAMQRLESKGNDYGIRRRVTAAVNIAGRENIREAVPFLRELEQSNSAGSSGGWFDMDGLYKEGEVNPFNQTEASMRRAVHLALRRIGEKPRELPCTWFRYTRAGGIGDYVELSDRTVPRADCVEFVKAGMTPKELLDTIGAPDFVNFGAEAWEYDMDAEKPYTLRVSWKGKKVVDRTERIMPAVWQHGETRYHQLNGW